MSTELLVKAARDAGVSDPRVLDAVRSVPRAACVPPEYAEAAEEDAPIPIPYQQTTSQPSLCARMIEALGVGEDDHVLEVGTGYGYQTALLARLAAGVTSVEYWAALATRARRNLVGENVHNVAVGAGDGTEGAPAHAPFDAVLVSAAFPTVPQPLVDQLRPGGRLVQPIGPGGADQVVVFERTRNGLVETKRLVAVRFVPLHGRHGYS